MHVFNLVTLGHDIAFEDVHSSAKIPSFLDFSFVAFLGDGSCV